MFFGKLLNVTGDLYFTALPEKFKKTGFVSFATDMLNVTDAVESPKQATSLTDISVDKSGYLISKSTDASTSIESITKTLYFPLGKFLKILLGCLFTFT